MAAVSCQHNHLFMTKLYYFGIAPRGTKIEDIVVVLDGGYYPFVLREVDGAENEYRSIGSECRYGSAAVRVLIFARLLYLRTYEGRHERKDS